MVRTFSAWAANSGLPAWVLVSALMNPSTLASSSGIASAATGGAIRGAAVSATWATGSGAVSVTTGSGGARGWTAASPAAGCSGVPAVMARSLSPDVLRVSCRRTRRGEHLRSPRPLA